MKHLWIIAVLLLVLPAQAQRVTSYSNLGTSVVCNDVFYVVDVSDPTDHATGSSFKLEVCDLINAMGTHEQLIFARSGDGTGTDSLKWVTGGLAVNGYLKASGEGNVVQLTGGTASFPYTYLDVNVSNSGLGPIIISAGADQGVVNADIQIVPGGILDYAGSEVLNRNDIIFDAATEHTIISGLGGNITASQTYMRVDTEADAASDELHAVQGATDGFYIILRPENDARTVVVRHNQNPASAFNLLLSDGVDFTMDDLGDFITLFYDSAFNGGTGAWTELSRSAAPSGGPSITVGSGTSIDVTDNTIGAAEIDETDTYSWSGAHTHAANVTFDDGVSNSPSAVFNPATGTSWQLRASDSDDNFNIFANTASTEEVDIFNLGAGVTNLSIDGDISFGLVSSGAWNGTAIAAQYGGTGLNTSASTGVPSISSGTWSVSATLTHELGGLEADISAYNGLIRISGGATSNITNLAGLNTALGSSIADGAHTADQVGTVNNGDFCQGGAGSVLDCDVTQNAGTDITADLEEETHATEHEDGGADAITFEDTICWWLENPTDADDLQSIYGNKTSVNFTLTEIWGESDQTVNFDLQVDDGTPADVNGTDISPAAGEAEDTTLSGDTTLAAGEEIDLVITSTSGTPTWFAWCLTYTRGL